MFKQEGQFPSLISWKVSAKLKSVRGFLYNTQQSKRKLSVSFFIYSESSYSYSLNLKKD